MATQVKVVQLFRIHDVSPCHNLNLYFFFFFFYKSIYALDLTLNILAVKVRTHQGFEKHILANVTLLMDDIWTLFFFFCQGFTIVFLLRHPFQNSDINSHYKIRGR